jgi:hypothetical protein
MLASAVRTNSAMPDKEEASDASVANCHSKFARVALVVPTQENHVNDRLDSRQSNAIEVLKPISRVDA